VGRGNVIHFAIKCDVKEVIPLLMIVFEQLKAIFQAHIVALQDGFAFEDENE
jgi:chorismate mutase